MVYVHLCTECTHVQKKHKSQHVDVHTPWTDMTCNQWLPENGGKMLILNRCKLRQTGNCFLIILMHAHTCKHTMIIIHESSGLSWAFFLLGNIFSNKERREKWNIFCVTECVLLAQLLLRQEAGFGHFPRGYNEANIQFQWAPWEWCKKNAGRYYLAHFWEIDFKSCQLH